MSEPIFKRGLQSKVSNLPVEDGSLIFGYDNSSNFSTFQFDQSVNGALKRLGVTVACSGTSDYSKNALALNGSSLDEIIQQVSNDRAFIELEPTTNNIVQLKRLNGEVVQKTVDNVSNATSATISSTAEIAKNSNLLSGYGIATATSGSSATFSNKIPFLNQDSGLEIGSSLDFHGDSTQRDYSIRLNGTSLGNLKIESSNPSTITAAFFDGIAKDSQALSGSSLEDILSKVGDSDKYLPLAGGEMEGILSLFKNQNSDNYSGALNSNNSNIYNINNLYFSAASNGINNTINFYKDSGHVDSLWSRNGILYYSPNRSFTSEGEENIVLHSKNINDYAAQVEHTHGLASSSLVISIPSVETGGWNLIDEKINNGSSPSGFTLKTIKTNGLTPDWMFNNASGLAFGGDSYRAVITVPYLNPGIRIAGGNGTSPRWFFSITGTNGNSYDLDSFITSSGLENINADSATRIISSGKSIANNFTFRTGIPLSSGWSNFPIWQLVNSQKPELIDYKNKNVSILHLDGETQRHDIVALNEPNSGLIYATGTTAVGSSSRIERILDGGNYGSLISDLNKHVNLNDGFTAQTNVKLDGGNYAFGSTVEEGGEDGNPEQSIEIYVTGTTLVINTI